MRLDHRTSFVTDGSRLRALCDALTSVPAFALDIETIEWWDSRRERIALLQLAYRAGDELRVAVVDTLAKLDLGVLREPLELPAVTKAIHNASFDAVRLRRQLSISTTPIHDTLLAARRSGEQRYSLRAQAQVHLGIVLDKSARLSDWSLRPLRPEQLDYAARDALATLLLYEHQVKRGLRGDYRLRDDVTGGQGALPLDVPSLHDDTALRDDTAPDAATSADTSPIDQHPAAADDRVAGHAPGGHRLPEGAGVSAAALALLGVVTELPTRYSPDRLAISVGEERIGLAGWIVDCVLGVDADVDERTAQEEITRLCRGGLIRVTPTGRLEASREGGALWREHQP